MGVECPACHRVTSNDHAPKCIGCGLKFNKVERKRDTGWQILAVCFLIGTVLTVFVVQRRC
jgi:hypothetical protein